MACLGWWWDQVIDPRDQLVLPLGGGPPVASVETRAVTSRLLQRLQASLERGHREGSIRADVTTRDLILFGAMLVTPFPGAADWGSTARRQKTIYSDGLTAQRRTAALPAARLPESGRRARSGHRHRKARPRRGRARGEHPDDSLRIGRAGAELSGAIGLLTDRRA